MSAHDLVFWIFALLAVGAAFGVAVSPDPLQGAILLLLCLFSVAGLFAWAGAHFLAAMQVLVYAGAIVVLFVFVIMLLNLTPRELGRTDLGGAQWLGLSCVVTAMVGISAVAFNAKAGFPAPIPGSAGAGATARIGGALLTTYAAPFEVVSLLLLASMGGAVMLVKRDQPGTAVAAIQSIRAQIDARTSRAFAPDPLQPDQHGPPARQAPQPGPLAGTGTGALDPGETL